MSEGRAQAGASGVRDPHGPPLFLFFLISKRLDSLLGRSMLFI